jgi:hypothetical protein
VARLRRGDANVVPKTMKDVYRGFMPRPKASVRREASVL